MAARPFESILRRLRTLGADRLEGGQSDGELLEQFVHRREEAAFETLLTRHGPMVWGVCRRRLPQMVDAEDAFQATFLLLIRKAGSIRQRESVASWLYGVAGRVAQRLREQAGRSPACLPAEEVPQPPAVPEMWHALQPILDEEIERLPERYRAPLVLCCLEGLSRDEAAARLGWKLGSLKGRLERGREYLRARLARRGIALSAALLVANLTEGTARAVPVAAREATIAAVVHGAISPSVATLTQGVIQAMFWTRLKLASALVVFLILGTGSGVWTYQALARETPTSVPAIAKEEGRPEKENLVAADPADPAAKTQVAAADPAPKPKLKTDEEILKFLFQALRKDKTVLMARSLFEERFQKVQRQEMSAFAKVFKKHELWLMSDQSPVGGGRNPRFLFALNRTKPEAFLISDVISDVFKENMAALFAAEGVAPKDNAEALALAKLVASLGCYASGNAAFRDDMSPEQLKAVDADLLAKFGKPTVEGKYKVELPTYHKQPFPWRGSIVVYKVEFSDGKLRFDAAEIARKLLNLR
jgi:RNA polymerase sigma factor (sigma-70 family)